MPRASAPDESCPGCLGDGRCWVCLGTGRLRGREGVSIHCHVCGGTGECAKCRRDRDPETPAVVDFVPAPRATSERVPASRERRASASRTR